MDKTSITIRDMMADADGYRATARHFLAVARGLRPASARTNWAPTPAQAMDAARGNLSAAATLDRAILVALGVVRPGITGAEAQAQR